MPCVEDVVAFLDRFAPPLLAEEWDNVGLLMGDRQTMVERVMTCLTITADSAAEAIQERAELIVTHHPLPFRPLKRITTDAEDGRLLWELARHGVAIYSPHTAFDSARDGINARLAQGLKLDHVQPLVLGEEDLGGGRQGTLPTPISLQELVERVKTFLRIGTAQFVGSQERAISRVAVACGSAAEFLPHAVAASCDCLVTGEMRFHSCLEAQSAGISLVLAGHYASERFAVEGLADVLAAQFANLHVWASKREQDPLHWQ
jgi:dinuclear metal center YbgI/SA1388 family protein